MKKYTVLFVSIFIFSSFSLQAREDGDDDFIRIPTYNIDSGFIQQESVDYSDLQKKEEPKKKTESKKEKLRDVCHKQEAKQEEPDNWVMVLIKYFFVLFGISS